MARLQAQATGHPTDPVAVMKCARCCAACAPCTPCIATRPRCISGWLVRWRLHTGHNPFVSRAKASGYWGQAGPPVIQAKRQCSFPSKSPRALYRHPACPTSQSAYPRCNIAMFSGGVGIFGVDISLLILLYQADRKPFWRIRSETITLFWWGVLYICCFYTSPCCCPASPAPNAAALCRVLGMTVVVGTLRHWAQGSELPPQPATSRCNPVVSTADTTNPLLRTACSKKANSSRTRTRPCSTSELLHLAKAKVSASSTHSHSHSHNHCHNTATTSGDHHTFHTLPYYVHL